MRVRVRDQTEAGLRTHAPSHSQVSRLDSVSEIARARREKDDDDDRFGS